MLLLESVCGAEMFHISYKYARVAQLPCGEQMGKPSKRSLRGGVSQRSWLAEAQDKQVDERSRLRDN